MYATNDADLWNKISIADQSNFIMAAHTTCITLAKNVCNLPCIHVYSILGAFTVTLQNG